MKIYQSRKNDVRNLILNYEDKFYNITTINPIIKTSLDLMMVSVANDSNVSSYVRKIIKNHEGKEKIDFENYLPIDSPEVWAFGVTYADSMKERQAESDTPDVYGKVYFADRPEAFFKSTLRRLRGPNETVGIRNDSTWDVPEPELTFIVYQKQIIGFTCGNDMSSRSIEGENPLYIPQAKIFKNSASIGPCWVPIECLDFNNLKVEMVIKRNSEEVFAGTCNTSQMKRKCDELNKWLNQSNDIPDGTTVMTGTGIIPPMDFTLSQNDLITISIENIGTLKNIVEKV